VSRASVRRVVLRVLIRKMIESVLDNLHLKRDVNGVLVAQEWGAEFLVHAAFIIEVNHDYW
jgi:hypothetical protein